MSRRRTEPLKWKWSDGFYFAHPAYGMWTIEQLRGRFIVTLDLKDTHNATQMTGNYSTSARAKAGAARDHRALVKLDA